MDLTVRECYSLCTLAIKVSQTHRDHSRLFFFNVHKFDESLLATSFEVPLLVTILLEHFLDVPFSDLELVVLNDIERSLDAASVGTEFNLPLLEITHNRNFSFNSAFTSQCLEVREESMSVTSESNPVSIHENLCHFLVTEILSSELLEFLHAPVLQLMDDISRVASD